MAVNVVRALRRTGLPPAVLFDIPVLVVLLVCWGTISVYWAHLLTGLLLTLLILVHLVDRRRKLGRLFARRPVSRPRNRMFWLIANLVFLIVATAMVASGLLRWANVPPQYAWHAASSYALLTVVGAHLIVEWRPLLARLRRHRAARRHRQLR